MTIKKNVNIIFRYKKIVRQLTKGGAEMPYVLREIKKTQNLIFRLLESKAKSQTEKDLTFPDRQICGFLMHSGSKPMYQKDIEKEFSLRRSSASTKLTKMEEKGLIVRVSQDSDKRLKRIELTDKAKNSFKGACKDVDDLEDIVVKNLPKEEVDSFIKTLKKLQAALIKESEYSSCDLNAKNN